MRGGRERESAVRTLRGGWFGVFSLLPLVASSLSACLFARSCSAGGGEDPLASTASSKSAIQDMSGSMVLVRSSKSSSPSPSSSLFLIFSLSLAVLLGIGDDPSRSAEELTSRDPLFKFFGRSAGSIVVDAGRFFVFFIARYDDARTRC